MESHDPLLPCIRSPITQLPKNRYGFACLSYEPLPTFTSNPVDFRNIAYDLRNVHAAQFRSSGTVCRHHRPTTDVSLNHCGSTVSNRMSRCQIFPSFCLPDIQD